MFENGSRYDVRWRKHLRWAGARWCAFAVLGSQLGPRSFFRVYRCLEWRGGGSCRTLEIDRVHCRVVSLKRRRNDVNAAATTDSRFVIVWTFWRVTRATLLDATRLPPTIISEILFKPQIVRTVISRLRLLFSSSKMAYIQHQGPNLGRAPRTASGPVVARRVGSPYEARVNLFKISPPTSSIFHYDGISHFLSLVTLTET